MFHKIAIVAAVSTFVGAALLPDPAMAGHGGWHRHFTSAVDIAAGGAANATAGAAAIGTTKARTRATIEHSTHLAVLSARLPPNRQQSIGGSPDCRAIKAATQLNNPRCT